MTLKQKLFTSCSPRWLKNKFIQAHLLFSQCWVAMEDSAQIKARATWESTANNADEVLEAGKKLFKPVPTDGGGG